jgi:predicted nucleotide-binding protein
MAVEKNAKRRDVDYEDIRYEATGRKGGAVPERDERLAVYELLKQQAEGPLQALFLAHGLSDQFKAAGRSWGKNKRVLQALMAAERRRGGALQALIEDARRRFEPAAGARSVPMVRAGTKPISVSAPPPRPDLALSKTRTARRRVKRMIFVVHGHDDGRKETVARFLEKIAPRDKVVILHEQPNQGRAIIEKFETYAAEASYVVVLMTADDVGRAQAEKDLKPRARQNVILELGWFIAQLGRERVAILYDEDVETPSDILGVLHIKLDNGGGWRRELARELKAANIINRVDPRNL